jgi:hypothetical protein
VCELWKPSRKTWTRNPVPAEWSVRMGGPRQDLEPQGRVRPPGPPACEEPWAGGACSPSLQVPPGPEGKRGPSGLCLVVDCCVPQKDPLMAR